jgi:hypothetical protein
MLDFKAQKRFVVKENKPFDGTTLTSSAVAYGKRLYMLASKYCTVSVLCLPCSCYIQKQTGHMVLRWVWRYDWKCDPKAHISVGMLTYLRARGISGGRNLNTHLLVYSSSFNIFCSPTSFPGVDLSIPVLDSEAESIPHSSRHEQVFVFRHPEISSVSRYSFASVPEYLLRRTCFYLSF